MALLAPNGKKSPQAVEKFDNILKPKLYLFTLKLGVLGKIGDKSFKSRRGPAMYDS